MAPPGNQAANRENKRQPVAMEVLGLLDLCCEFGYYAVHRIMVMLCDFIPAILFVRCKTRDFVDHKGDL